MKKVSISILGILFLALAATVIYRRPTPAPSSHKAPHQDRDRVPASVTSLPPHQKQAAPQIRPKPTRKVAQKTEGKRSQNQRPPPSPWKKNLTPKERYGLFEPPDELTTFHVEGQHYFVSKLYSAILKTDNPGEKGHATIGRYLIVDKDQQGLPVVYHPNSGQAGIVTGQIDVNIKANTNIDHVVSLLSQQKELYTVHSVVPRLNLVHLKTNPEQNPLTVPNQIRSISQISEVHSDIYWGGVHPQ